MRIAGPASHQIFERNKRAWLTPRACPLQYDLYYNPYAAEDSSAVEKAREGAGNGVGLRALVLLVTGPWSSSVFSNTNLKLAR